MDWSKNSKGASIDQRSSRDKKRETANNETSLKELGESFNSHGSTLKKEVLDIIMKKRGLEKGVNDNKITEDNTKARTKEQVDERVLDNIRNNRTEQGGAEESKNPYAQNQQKNAQQRTSEERIHRRETRANKTQKILKKHKIKLPPRLKAKALENVKDNPTLEAKKFEKAARKRATSSLFSFNSRNNKYYQEFAKYFGKKVAKKDEKDEKSQIKKIEKSQSKKRDLIKEKSGRGNPKTNKKVTKRELTAENIRIARERAAQRTK